MFTNKKREGINSFVCAVSLYVAETPKPSIKNQEHQLPIIPFGIVAYSFVGQPFSKQLYDAGSRNRARDTLVGGERSHHYTPSQHPYSSTSFCMKGFAREYA